MYEYCSTIIWKAWNHVISFDMVFEVCVFRASRGGDTKELDIRAFLVYISESICYGVIMW